MILLWCFDWVEPAAIKSCWTQNFMLDVKKITLAATVDRLHGKKFSQGGLMEKYVATYESWRAEQGQTMSESDFEALDSNLDGSYWSK